MEARRREHPDFTLFWGVESDILGDGSLDYPDEVLKLFDFVIASILPNSASPGSHDPLLTAMANPYCTMLGHSAAACCWPGNRMNTTWRPPEIRRGSPG